MQYVPFGLRLQSTPHLFAFHIQGTNCCPMLCTNRVAARPKTQRSLLSTCVRHNDRCLTGARAILKQMLEGYGRHPLLANLKDTKVIMKLQIRV